MGKIKAFFKQRWIGFFLLIPVALMSFIIPFVYMSGFLRTDYMSVWAVILPFAAIGTIALAFFKKTARFAPIAMFAMELAGLLVFIETSYMHLTTAFFGGINGNIFVQAGFSFSFCTIAFVLNIVICIAAMCFGQYRGEKQFFGNESKEPAAKAPEETGKEGNK